MKSFPWYETWNDFSSYKWQFYVKGTGKLSKLIFRIFARRATTFSYVLCDGPFLHGKTTALSKSPATLLGKCARYNEKW